ncbi:MAG: ABC transporter ATP-binding protein [Candidatus Anammoxibacter sp.]
MYNLFINIIRKNELLRDCSKLYGFGMYHWKMVLLAALCMAIYTSLICLQLALVKPVIDKLIRGEVPAATKTIEHVDAPDDTSAEQLNTYKIWTKKASGYIEGIGFVRNVRLYIEKITSSFTNIGILAAIIAPFIFLSFYGQKYFSNYVIWGITRDIRNRVCEHLLPQPLNFFENKKSGELISSITNDITTTQGAVNVLFSNVLLQPMKLIFGLGLASYFNWQLTMISFAAFPLIVVPVVIFGRKVKKHGKSSLGFLADLTDFLREMFSGIRIVKAYSMEKEETGEIRNINQKFFKKRMKAAMSKATSNGITEFIFGIGLAVIIIMGGHVVSSGKITAGELGGFITAIGFMVFRSIKQLSKSYNTLQDSLAGASRVFEVLNQITDKNPDGIEDLERIKDSIKFNNVSFAYDRKTVLKSVNFEIKSGTIIGIVGQSGAGKSTILNLVLRFYNPTGGTIEIDGRDIKLFKHKSLLDHIALVTQQTFLFNRSIEDNIGYGCIESNHGDIEKAAKAADIHDFIISLPNGYKTIVGEVGAKLSGGQRQRIAIARAFLKDAPVLILDEATSSLDSKSELAVQDTLNNLMKGKTTLVVAHRLSTIKNCDKILVVKDGIVVETGTHEELFNAGGEYNMLYKMQSHG